MTWKLIYQDAVLAASIPSRHMAETLKQVLQADYVSGNISIEVDSPKPDKPMFYLLFDMLEFRPMNATLFSQRPNGFRPEDYPKKFRLCDGDGTQYFMGIAREEADFQPLDATKGHYGCDSIQYLDEDGDWAEL